MAKTRKRSRRSKGGNIGNAKAAEPVANAPIANAAAVPVVSSNANSAKPNSNNAKPSAEGGKRKTRKMAKGPSDWNKKVMTVYHEMKKKNPATKLGDAMRECSKRKKRGEL